MSGRTISYNETERTPTRFVVFLAAASVAADTDDEKTATMRCLHVSSVLVTKNRGHWNMMSLETHKKPHDFWRTLFDLVPKKRRLWCFGYDLIPQLSLSGFWRWVDAEGVYFFRHDGEGRCKDGQKRNGNLVLNGPPTYVTARKETRSLRVCDFRNYVDCPLHDLLAERGVHPAKAAELYGSGDIHAGQSLEICQCLADLMISWLHKWEETGGGVWQPTAGKLAMTSYRHFIGKWNKDAGKSLRHDVLDEPYRQDVPLIIYDDSEANKFLARLSYFGGRSEAYFVGNYPHKVYYVDCRSMYPYLAHELALPYKCIRSVQEPSANVLVGCYPTQQCIAAVRVRAAQPIYPVRVPRGMLHGDSIAYDGELLQPVKRDTITVFPIGEFDTVLCGEELRWAIDRGDLVHAYVADVYQCGHVLADWMERQYEQRCQAEENGDKPYAMLCKLQMNALIGKFGSKSARWADCPHIQAATRWGMLPVKATHDKHFTWLRFIAGHTQMQQEPVEIKNNFTPIPAFVCSAGRKWLWEMMQWAGEDQVLMCHTDGMIVTEQGRANLELANMLSGSGWGTMRIIDSSSSITIVNPTRYTWGNVEVAAGVPADRMVTVNGTVFGWTNEHIPCDPAKVPALTFKVRLLRAQPRHKYIGRRIGDGSFTKPWECK